MNFKRMILLILLIVVSCVMDSCSNKEETKMENNNVKKEGTAVIETSSDENSRVLTVSSFMNNIKMERFAEEFHKLHPDVVVQIEIFSKSTMEVISEESTISIEKNEDGTEITSKTSVIQSIQKNNPSIDLQPDKYVLKINTDLMSGQGCDILDLSYLPSAAYADSNYLVDLYELFEQDSEISIEDYYTNVFKAYEYKNKLYQLPLGFQYYYCGINNAYLPENFKHNENYWNYNMMFELYNQTNGLDSSLFRGYTPGQPIRNDFNTYFNVKNKTCDINNDQFINILTRAFECYNADEEIVGTSAKIDMTNHLFLMLDYPFEIRNYKDYYQEEFSYLHPLLNSEGKITLNPFSPGRLAINNNSKEKELAWEFIKFCLSDWAQQDAIAKPRLEEDPIGIRGFSSFPIKKSAFEAVFANDPVMDEELYQELKEWNESDFEANLADAVITQMFSDELRSYRQGSQTAGQTAENLQNKVSTYLNE
jgi:ABC-type glycerol-3-phosphate transport system substrate-binding protein